MLTAWDTQLLAAIHSHPHHPFVMRGMAWFTRVGAPPLVVALAVVNAWLAWPRRRLEALAGGAGVVGAITAAVVVKELVRRPRPPQFLVGSVSAAAAPEGLSFPSGHATAAFALAAVLSACWPRHRAWWWTLAAGVAFSRIYLGVHFPSDCLAGAVLGSGMVMIAIWWGRRCAPQSLKSH